MEKERQLIQDNITSLYSNNWQSILHTQWLLLRNIISDSTKQSNLSPIMPCRLALGSLVKVIQHSLRNHGLWKLEESLETELYDVLLLLYVYLYYVDMCAFRWSDLLLHQLLIHYSRKSYPWKKKKKNPHWPVRNESRVKEYTHIGGGGGWCESDSPQFAKQSTALASSRTWKSTRNNAFHTY